MINFFRKIRKKLADDNKPLKYIRYAIGEILLVVIGILIALQINNSNNSKQERKIEQEYLQSLQVEFETNLRNLDTLIVRTTEQMESVDKLLTLFDKSILDTINDKLMFDMIYDVLLEYTTYKPSVGVLTDIISSGNLNLIQNKKLRQQLASFKISLVSTKDHEISASTNFHAMREFNRENISLRKLLLQAGMVKKKHNSISDTVNNKSLFKSIEFENRLLVFYAFNRLSNMRVYPDLKIVIENILLEIEKEIEK